MDYKDTIQESIEQLRIKLSSYDIDNSDISDYNKFYLNRYLNDFEFYMSQYLQLFIKVLNKLNKPINDSTFVDYGGGSGVLSYMASLIGFKQIIYVDLNQSNANDVMMLSQKMGLNIDLFVIGDIDILIEEVQKQKISFDVICSFDVLEHIYNLTNWFKQLSVVNHDFLLFFQTGANSKNPFIAHKLKKHHIREELIGNTLNTKIPERDSEKPFLKLRKELIQKHSPELTISKVEFLGESTRGLKKEDIETAINEYKQTGIIEYSPSHPTNTCDPYTGSWSENLINLDELKISLKNMGFNVRITNVLYGFSKNKMINIFKFILNVLLKLAGPNLLFLSPAYTLELSNKKKLPSIQ